MKTRTSFFFNYLFTPLTIFLYFAFIYFYRSTNVNLFFLPGLLLFFFLPGFNLLPLLRINSTHPLIKIAFSVILSMASVIFSFAVVRGYTGFFEAKMVALVIILNALAWIVNLIWVKRCKTKTLNQDKSLAFWLIGLTPFILFAVRSLINPYLVDQDGEKYIYIMEKIQEYRVDGSFLSNGRYLFSYLIMSCEYLTKIGFVNLFKFVFPAMIWLSLPAIGILIKPERLPSRNIILLLIASPAFMGQIDRFKPESASIAIVIPAIIFFVLSLREKNILYYIIGFIFSFIASKLHETGNIFLFSYLFSSLMLAFLNRERLKKYMTRRNIMITLIVIFPYIMLLELNKSVGNFLSSISLLGLSDTKVGFNFWFLDNFRSLNADLSWPGFSFVYYYAFNGALIVILAIIAIFRLLKAKLRSNYEQMVLPTISFLIFLSFAEILPRLNIFVMPDRSMIHLFLFSGLILVVAFSISKPNQYFLEKYIVLLLIVNLIGSASLSLFLASNAGSLVSRAEDKLIDQIRRTEKNSLILSTQSFNQTLVETYGKREFVAITLPDSAAKDSNLVKDYILSEIEKGEITHDTRKYPVTVEKRANYTSRSNFLVFNDGIYVVKASEDSDIDPERVTTEKTTISDDTPVYLFYSFIKSKGFLSKVNRKYLSDGFDIKGEPLLIELSKTSSSYSDPSGVIIKLR